MTGPARLERLGATQRSCAAWRDTPHPPRAFGPRRPLPRGERERKKSDQSFALQFSELRIDRPRVGSAKQAARFIAIAMHLDDEFVDG
jgi:hypothetical protein